MKAGPFLRILTVSVLLAAYSGWTLGLRDKAEPLTSPGAYGSVADIPLLRIAEAEALWREPTTLFLDVRSANDFTFGHIQGALSLPEEEFELRFPALKPRLQRARALVVYCSSIDCGKSLWTALRLRHEGLSQTMIYPRGWNEWFTHDLPRTVSGK